MPRSMRLSFARWVWLTAREQRGENATKRAVVAFGKTHDRKVVRAPQDTTGPYVARGAVYLSVQPRQGPSSAAEGR